MTNRGEARLPNLCILFHRFHAKYDKVIPFYDPSKGINPTPKSLIPLIPFGYFRGNLTLLKLAMTRRFDFVIEPRSRSELYGGKA